MHTTQKHNTSKRGLDRAYTPDPAANADHYRRLEIGASISCIMAQQKRSQGDRGHSDGGATDTFEHADQGNHKVGLCGVPAHNCGMWCLRCADALVWCRSPFACERVWCCSFFTYIHT